MRRTYLKGWILFLVLVSAITSYGQVMNSCNSTFTDTGGSDGNYENNENYLVTYCADNGGKMRALFKEFSLSSQEIPDTLYVYDGPSTFSNIIGKYSGSLATPGEEFTINSLIRGNGSCLTFQFVSGSSGTSSGWEAEIYCLAPPQGGIEICGDGIDNDADGLIDQADPDCLIEPSVENCFVGNHYYIPPIWQLNTTNDTELNGPASLRFSTRYPSAEINVRTLDNSYNQSFTVTSAAELIQSIPLNYLQTSSPNQTENNKGFIVSSDVPIDIKYLTDGSLNKNHISIRGREGLGRGFRVGSQTNTRVATASTVTQKEAHFISVMASEDETDVTFTFDIPMTGLTSPHTVRLNRGESYLIKDDDNNVSVSGALVSATKNIAVFSGSQYTQAFGTTAQDGGIDQIIPASKAGTNYVLTRSGNDSDQDYAIVVPIENGTNIFLDGTFIQTATIDAGDYYQIPLNGGIGQPLHIRTSRPAMVYHISGQNGGNVGMAVVPPIGSCRGDNILNFSKINSADNHILNIVLPTAGISTLRLNGSPVSGITSAVPGFAGFSTILVQEAGIQNSNTLTGTTNFTAGLIASSSESSVYSYLTSYRETIDFLDVVTGLPIEFIDLDTICNGSGFDYTFQVESCGAGHRLISIEESGMMGTAEITDAEGLSITFLSEGVNTGQNFISVVIENNLGNRSSICVGFVVDDLKVDLGEDLTSCTPDNFELSANPTGGEPPYSYLWSNGETTSSINVNPATTESFAVTVTDQEGCDFVDDVNISIGSGPQLICKEQINISLNNLCESELTAADLLTVDIGTEDIFIIKIEDQYGNVVPDAIINEKYINKNLVYTVETNCGNSCWGNVYVEDNYIPIINCGSYDVLCSDDASPDSIGYPVLFENPIILAPNVFVLSGVDACSDVTLSYTEDAVDQECDSGLEKIIYRNWLVIDESGNRNSCADTINILKENINTIVFPLNRDDKELPAIACDSDYGKLENGHPSTDSSAGGGLQLAGCKSIQVAFEDTYLESCGTSYKILREWKLYDWCTGLSRDHYQVIKVLDKEPPTFVCPAPLTVYTSPYECSTGLITIPPPSMQDNCNETGFSVKVNVTDNDVFGHAVDSNNVVDELPLGINTVYYTMFDACDNQDTCSTTITVEDDKAPFAIADQHTVASIGSDGTTRIFAENFDDGSFDNCGLKLMKVRKKVDSCGSDIGDYLYNGQFFNDYVDFCCAEVGDEDLRVQFLVEDIHGNVNVVWVEVTLNDKLPPVISAPPNITITCDHEFYYDDLSLFGEIAEGDEPRKPINIYDDYNNGFVGLDGFAVDNCYLEVSEEVDIDLECGAGEITRTFTALDNNGMTAVDVQVITVRIADPFTEDQILWPEKITIEGCVNVEIDTTVTGSPIYIDQNCAKLAAEYEDKVFSYAGGGCLTIHREWEVQDWCSFNPETGEGLWKYTQVIYVENNTAPVYDYDYQDTVVCIVGNCEGLVDLSVTATDDCTEELYYKWRVDFDLDGNYDDQGTGNQLQETWEPGRYFIAWSVEDLCGNVAFKRYYVTVEDCKAPTPYCISGIATALMPTTGSIQLWASDYELESFDNCTDESDLLFSFSKDTSDTFFTVRCDMMDNGAQQSFPLEVWVTDQAGNQDFCSVVVKVNDNFDVCPDVDQGYVNVKGEILAYKSEIKMDNVQVTLETNSDLHEIVFTDEEGRFEFNDLPSDIDFRVRPLYDEEYRSGVTTLDIIIIQKHLLGISRITDPYKLIAADVNNSSSLSGIDLLQIRKLILGLTDTFSKNTSWRFVDRNYVFADPSNPWGWSEDVDLEGISGSYSAADLIGIKIGDVNGSYVGSGLRDATVRQGSFVFEGEDQHFSSGEEVVLNLAAGEGINIEGFQASLKYDSRSLEWMNISGGVIELEAENYSNDLEEGILGLTYDRIGGVEIGKEDDLFTVRFMAKTDGLLSEVLRLETGHMWPEVYETSGEIHDVDLSFRSIDLLPKETVVLHQNEPNPFIDQTRINFELPDAREVDFRIFDTSGKLVYSRTEEYGAGAQQIVISSKDLGNSGVFYYQLTAGDFQGTNKMIFTN